MRRAPLWVAALLAALSLGAALAPAPGLARTGDVSAGPDSLPDFPGRELAYGFCAGCHSFQVIGRQGMSRERWDSTLLWMSERHGMPTPDADIRKELLDFLEKAYPERPAAARGWANPFAPN
jgi:hypothetical protein